MFAGLPEHLSVHLSAQEDVQEGGTLATLEDTLERMGRSRPGAFRDGRLQVADPREAGNDRVGQGVADDVRAVLLPLHVQRDGDEHLDFGFAVFRRFRRGTGGKTGQGDQRQSAAYIDAMKTSARRWRLLLLFLLAAGPSLADGLHFERVGSVSGPPPEVITTIYEDRAGFIWIGSRDGLIRYDGYTFEVFEHDISDPKSISDNSIRIIYEDSRLNLWVGTNTGGLNRLDRATWEFEHFRHDSGEPSSLSHDSVYAIVEDGGGDLWVGTQVGLNRLDRETSTFERILHVPGVPGGLSHDYVFWLHADPDGRLWVSTIGGGLNVRDPETGRFSVYRHDPDDPYSISSDNPLVLEEDSSGALWVATMDGVNLFERETETFRRFGMGPSTRTRLSDTLATSLAIGNPGTLWIGTQGGGLNRIEASSGEVRTWRHDPTTPQGLGDDIVSALLRDSSGSLWIGTWGGGLSRLTPASLLVSSSADRARMPAGLNSRDLTALAHDRSGGLWIGTRSGDLVRRDPDRGIDRMYLSGGDDGTGRIVYQVVEDLSGNVWVGTNAGLLRLDPLSGSTTEFKHDPQDSGSLGPGYVKALLVDDAGKVWVGTGEGGLQCLDEAGRVVGRYLHDPADPGSLSDDYVTSILQDRNGAVWVGTRSAGLNRVDIETHEVTRYLPDRRDPESLSHHSVSSIYEDSTGHLWIGTGGGGLNRLRDDQVRFERFTEKDGLLDDDVMGIVEDEQGSLWVSTKRGLARLDPHLRAFSNLVVADGLPSGEFEPGAVTRDRTSLYFGSVKGLVAVPSGIRFPEPTPSPTVITGIRTAQGELPVDRPVWELERIEVPWGEWLSMQFAVLDYSSEHRHGFAYRLGGSDAEWIDLGSRREITFTDLDSGIHELAIRGRNHQGVWSAVDPVLRIEVIPPFWMTWWFRSLALLVVVGVVVTAHRVRVNAVKRRNIELIRLHGQREKAREELARAYDRLRHLTRRLEAAKEEERRHIARELHDELGPALTAVIINLHLVRENPENSDARVADTIDLADRLVDQVRDLSLDLRPPLLDELGLVPALRGYIETEAKRAGILIDVVEDGPVKELPAEVEITAFRLVQEAVTNVIRHAEAETVNVTVRRDNGDLELSVKDDGRGFDVDSTLAGPAAGALGLIGMHERVQNLGGELKIDSAPGRGTTVRGRMSVGGKP